MIKRSKFVAFFLLSSLLMNSCAACGKKSSAAVSDSDASITATDVSISNINETLTTSSTSEPEPMKEDTSWHYGTVERPNLTEKKQLYFFQVPVKEDNVADGILFEVEGSDQEKKISDAINQECIDIKFGEWDHIGSAVLEKMYPHHEVSVVGPVYWVVNNIMSVFIGRWDEFTSSEDEYGEYFETMYYSNYNIVTGERMQLKDIFYEDTDYVSLLNDVIRDWLIEHNDLERSILFTGISEDQQFYIKENGSLVIYIDDDVYVTLSPFDVMQMTALADAVPVDASTQERGYFLPAFTQFDGDGDGEFKSSDRCMYTCYCGLDGVNENRAIGYLCEVPDEVRNFLLQEELMQTNTEEMRAAKDSLDDLGVTLSVDTYYQVDRIGEVYVASYMFSRMGDSIFDEHFSEEEAAEVYDAAAEIVYTNKNGNYVFDQSGKRIQIEDMFEDDVDLRQVLTDALKSGKANWVMSWGVTDDANVMLESMEHDVLYELVQQASLKYTTNGIEIYFQDDPAYAVVTQSIYCIGWDVLVEYMKE